MITKVTSRNAHYKTPHQEYRSAFMHKEIVEATYKDGWLIKVEVIGHWK